MSHRTGAGAAVNPDNIVVFYITAALTFVVFAASATISFFGLYAIGVEQGLPRNIAWTTPVMIDFAILVFTMVSLIQRRRGNKFARFFAIFAVGLVTLLSMALNCMHSYYEVGVDAPMQIGATVANTLAPLFIWITTEMLVGLVTKQPPAPRTQAAPRKAKAATATATRKRVVKPPVARPVPAVEAPSFSPRPASPAALPAFEAPQPQRSATPVREPALTRF